MNDHQISSEAVARNRALTSIQSAAVGSGHPAPGDRKLVMMHASEADYVDWVVAESQRLEKQNGILRGLLLKATHELRKSNPACADLLVSLTPPRAPASTPDPTPPT
jgi:hypothetical protein